MSISAAKQQASLRALLGQSGSMTLGLRAWTLETSGLGHILALQLCDLRQVIYLSVSQF